MNKFILTMAAVGLILYSAGAAKADDAAVYNALIATENYWNAMISYYLAVEQEYNLGDCGSAIAYTNWVAAYYNDLYNSAVETCNLNYQAPDDTTVSYCNYAWYNLLVPAYPYVLSANNLTNAVCGSDIFN